MRITCYGGVGQIGGNKILVEDGAASFFFDFGTPFGDRGRFFEEFLTPRSSTGLLDVMEMGLLPPLRGIYRPDFEPHPGFWDRMERSPHLKTPLRQLDHLDGVLLSHAHVDHNGYLSFLRTDVPVYASATTAFIAKAMQDSGNTDFERETVYAVPREPKDGLVVAANARHHPADQRPYRLFDGLPLSDAALDFWGRPATQRELFASAPTAAMDLGGLPLQCFGVDHSIYGSAAYAVQTSAGWVAYTGDVRLHGRHAAGTRRFIDAMRALHPRVLICEGTRLSDRFPPEEPVSEEEVLRKALAAVRAASGLVAADFGPRNVERLETFLHIARETGRQLVILDKDAYLLDAMALITPGIPTVASEPRLLVYQDARANLSPWQKRLRETVGDRLGRLVGADYVRTHLGEVILCISFWDVKNLIDIDPPAGLYLYSSSEVYDEEGEMDIRRLTNWLRHFSLSPLGVPEESYDDQGKRQWKPPLEGLGLHASGHASGEEILQLVQEIEPETVVPVHTQHPHVFAWRLAGTKIEVRLPEYGVPLEF